MSSHEIEHLLHEYGCGLVFVVVALQALGVPITCSLATSGGTAVVSLMALARAAAWRSV